MFKLFLKSSYLKVILAFGLLLLAFWVLHREVAGLHYTDIQASISQLPAWRVAAAVLLTVCSYLVLTGYDMLALQYVNRPMPYRKAGLASFISYAFSNTIGFSLLTSGTIRYRMYSAWGLSFEDISKMVLFSATTFWLGILCVGGTLFVAEPKLTAIMPNVLPFPAWYLGVIFVVLVLLYLGVVALTKDSVRLWRIQLPLPGLRLGLKQVLLGTVDWLLAGCVLVILFPAYPEITFSQLLAVYLVAQIIALISYVPGGIGVFETLIIIGVKPIPVGTVIATLLIFRAIYYLLPLLVASILAALFELQERKHKIGVAVKRMERWSGVLLPHLFALLMLIAGAVLLFSGATPAITSRLYWLERFLPLPVIELSHFLGSLVGAFMLLLARGLQKRLDGAYVLSIGMLALGIGLSLLKGGDYEEAVLLGILLISLLPCRHFFRRRASLLTMSFSIGWVGTIGIVILSALGLTLFASRHFTYSSDLWWHFALLGDAPRSLRAGVGATIVLLLFALSRLLRATPPVTPTPSAEMLATARKIIDGSPDTIGNLALLGDKQLLFNSSNTAMIMYAVQGQSWVVLGDPIGPVEEHEDLIWKFRDLCEQYNGRPIFYEVSPQGLHLYLNIGLSILKLGEEARVFLPEFFLEGKKNSGLRYSHRRAEKEGYSFSIIPKEEVPTVMADLKQISDAWLGEKNTREKGFSLGFFTPEYLLANPVALVKHEDRIVAFANLWTGSNKDELSIDLMRYNPDASRGVMEYLLISLMLWGRKNGFKWFNLGMAPLSGMEIRAGSPLWNRLGGLLFRHGEDLYNFQGLREYKEKFNPKWEPRYLASPGGLALPLILTDITTLISGGVKGVFRK